MKRRLLKLFKEEKGTALFLIGITLPILMGMAAFGADLAWFYINASRVQRTADAAALGGVVWVPGDLPTAFSTADDIALRNGYDKTLPDIDVTPAAVAGELNQLQVTVRSIVPTFFLKVLGFDQMTVTRSAVAEFIPPLKLGSPSNTFGNDPSCYTSDPNCAGNFWANIHGRQTDTRMGDAYSSYCFDGDGSNNGCSMNPSYRDSGYLYGMIPGGGSVTLQTLDMNFHYDGIFDNDDQHRTGDHNNFCGSFPPCEGPTVVVNVYEPDPTPLDISDNTLSCSETYSPQPQDLVDDDPPFNPALWSWDTVCGGAINTSSSPTGIWVVQVVNVGENANRSGLNRYSIRTDIGNIFALGDFSIYNNASGLTTAFHVAEIPDYYAGKTFVIEMYDPGESAADGTLQVVDPTGSVFNGGECRIYARDEVTDPWTQTQTISSGSPCEELVNPGEYNGQWLKFEMDIPVVYTCATCWWKMNYAYTSAVNDTTTWRAYILGNPIHLVPVP